MAQFFTVFADASWCPKTKAGGWGAWAKCHVWPQGQTFGGRLKVANSASSSELRALANATGAIRASGALLPGASLLLQSDCTWALQALHNVPGMLQRAKELVYTETPIPVQTYDEEVIAFMAAIKQDLNLTIYLRHVKGHNGSKDGRSWVNERCDAIARQYMLEGRKAEEAQRRFKNRDKRRRNGGQYAQKHKATN